MQKVVGSSPIIRFVTLPDMPIVRRVLRELRRQDPSMRRSYLRFLLDGKMPNRAIGVVAAVTGAPRTQVAAFFREDAARDAARTLAAAEREYVAATGGPGAGLLRPEEAQTLYALVRAVEPDLVVETGTASGSSTYFILSALARNGRGRLMSIDLPFVGAERRPVVAGTSIGEYDASPIPEGREPGWIVPMRLRDRWELRVGDARTLLPAIDEEIDLFFHDSLHTRDHMLFEFVTAWPKLAAGGILASDDVFQARHDAFSAFAAEVGRGFATFRGFGFIRR